MPTRIRRNRHAGQPRDWTLQPEHHHRRSFLRAVGRTAAGAAAAYTMRSGAAIFAPALLPQAARAAAQFGEPLIQPSQIRSANGLLEATITAAPGRVQLDDFALSGYLYNGAYLPPVLRPRLGDTMRITLKNNLADDPTNLHYHGMAVSPQGVRNGGILLRTIPSARKPIGEYARCAE
jgi:suppressor of ftsI